MTTAAATPAARPTDDAAARSMTVGELTDLLGISQSTCSHHVRKS